MNSTPAGHFDSLHVRSQGGGEIEQEFADLVMVHPEDLRQQQTVKIVGTHDRRVVIDLLPHFLVGRKAILPRLQQLGLELDIIERKANESAEALIVSLPSP